MPFLAVYLLTIADSLLQLDRDLFQFVNGTAAMPSFDWLFMALRHAFTWIPLYVFVLFWIITRHRRYAWQFILLTLVTFAITDWVSASVLKPYFQRLRPCHDPVLQAGLRDLVGCGGQYGMPSSHASNHFGMAAFWYFAVLALSGRRWWWLWLWAFLICYAQVYVGKHFPGDVLVGGVFGIGVGALMALFFRRWMLAR